MLINVTDCMFKFMLFSSSFKHVRQGPGHSKQEIIKVIGNTKYVHCISIT